MTSEDPFATDLRVASILDVLSRIAAGDGAARATSERRGDTLDRVLDQLNLVAEGMSARYAAWSENERRLDEILDVVSGMAALDFTKKATVTGAGSVIDAAAFGLNMLSEELAATMVSRAYVDNILESMIDALVVVGPDGTIKTANRTAARLFGHSKEELSEQPVDILFERPEAGRKVLGAMTPEGGFTAEETTCRAADGRLFPAAFSASLMVDAKGDPEGIVCTIRDITEQKEAEEALRRGIAQEETIRAQAAALAELSTPLIPISNDVVVMPLIGSVDARRARQVLETLLYGVARARAAVAIIDITGVPLVDLHVAHALLDAARAVKLLGARVLLTGIRPEVARTLVDLDADLRGIVTYGTLQSGIAAVLKHGHRKVGL